ncbi:MAG: acyltransferase [Pseudomonadota bacterium]
MHQSRFSPRLEALRGVAALMVALFHSFAAIKLTTPESESIGHAVQVLGNGSAGVAIFFVLSGYVLGLSMENSARHPLKDWLPFVLRRILRIYPAMTGCLLFCWLYLAHVHHYIDYPAARVAIWNAGASGGEFLRNLLLASNSLNTVTWTLQVEMLGSLVIPLLFFIKSKTRAGAGALLMVWLGCFAFTDVFAGGHWGFLYMFLLGLFVPDLDAFIARHVRVRWGRPLIAAVAFAGCCLASFTWISLWAVVLVAALAGAPRDLPMPILDWSATRYLGRISYSFYLWHLPVLIIVTSFVMGSVDNAWLLAWPITSMALLFVMSVAAAVAVAHVSHRWLEVPFKGGGGALQAMMSVVGRARKQPALNQ